MTKYMNFDYIILGSGVAGYSAAMTLAKAGKSVGVIEIPTERVIRGLFKINPTPLNRTELDGGFFEERIFWDICKPLGVHRSITYMTNIIVNQEGFSLVLDEPPFEEIWSFSQSVIFAPNFSHPMEQLEYIKNAEECYGKGLSLCAWSDMPFCKEKNVCVIGNGYWAYDQIRYASYYTNDVTFLCTTPSYQGGIISEFKLRELIYLKTDVKVYSISLSKRGLLIVHFLAEGVEQKILFDGVFFAPEQICDWSIIGGKERAKQLNEQGLVHFAGIAAGIQLWDHNAQYKHGVEVAELCLK